MRIFLLQLAFKNIYGLFSASRDFQRARKKFEKYLTKSFLNRQVKK